MRCPSCGKETSDSRQFCEHCDSPLNAAPGAKGKRKLPLPGILALSLLAAGIVLSLFLFPAGKEAPAEAASVQTAREQPASSAAPAAPAPEPVMSYAEYAAAPSGSPVVIEAFVQDRQDWWNGKLTVYAQDRDGGYFIYDMACPEEALARLVPGQKIRVSGVKTVYWDAAEILDASFEFADGETWIASPMDLTDLLGHEDLILYQNRLVLFRDMTVEAYDESGAAFAFQDPESRDGDLYFRVSREGRSFEFRVECFLRGSDSAVYRAVEDLRVGDVVDLEGFLHWENGPAPHITSVTVRQREPQP